MQCNAYLIHYCYENYKNDPVNTTHNDRMKKKQN